MITHQVAIDFGQQMGLPVSMVEKTGQVVDAGKQAHAQSHRAGVTMVYGSDLLGDMHQYQLRVFELPAPFQTPLEIWRSATVPAAELFRMSGLVGTIQTIAYADMLVDDRNSVEDLQVVMHPQEHLRFISRAGVIAKNTLT